MKGEKTFIVGCVVRAPNYLEGVLKREIEVDGSDVTDKIIDMMKSRFGVQVRVIMLNGITFGGFNIADLNRIYKETGVGILSIVRKVPNMLRIEKALREHFDDWRERLEIIKNIPEIKYNRLYVNYAGISPLDVQKIIDRFTLRGNIPEPIRMAHIIASGIGNLKTINHQ